MCQTSLVGGESGVWVWCPLSKAERGKGEFPTFLHSNVPSEEKLSVASGKSNTKTETSRKQHQSLIKENGALAILVKIPYLNGVPLISV